MSIPINLLQPGNSGMDINLCRSQTGMTQKLLDRVQVRPFIQQMSSRGMPQDMRALFYLLGYCTKISIYNSIDKRFINFKSPGSEKQKFRISNIIKLIPGLKVAVKTGNHRIHQGNNPLLISFSANFQDSGGNRNILKPDSD